MRLSFKSSGCFFHKSLEGESDRSWAIRSIPVLLKEREDRADALLELSLGGDLQTAQVATACRSAIR
ncbi:MAG: hypothetical protein IM507_22580, partial [Microcystis sp. M20BS1]